MVWGFESPPAHQSLFTSRVAIMTVTVETLEKLQRRITLMLAAETINGEVETRLKKQIGRAHV